jgi:hypothetical protein
MAESISSVRVTSLVVLVVLACRAGTIAAILPLAA